MLRKVFDQSVFRYPQLTANANAAYLPTSHQLICCIPADAENGHQILHPEGQQESIMYLLTKFFYILCFC